jgi:HK97 family phage major capsid protein
MAPNRNKVIEANDPAAHAAAIMKLKDLEGRLLWTQSLADGQPNRLLGYPVETWEQLDDLDVTGGSNATYPIAFGNWNRAYLLVDRVGMRIVVDPYSTPGFTRFYISRREGGCVLNNDAAKWLKTAA